MKYLEIDIKKISSYYKILNSKKINQDTFIYDFSLKMLKILYL